MEMITFDAAAKLDDKAEELEVIKIEKQDQLETSLKNLKVDIAKAKRKFKTSITDPNVNSVTIMMDIDVMEKELKYTRDILKGIFPDAD